MVEDIPKLVNMESNFNTQIQGWKKETSMKRYKSKVAQFLNILRYYSKDSDSILELGCGVTLYPEYLNYKKYHAIDISEELLKLNDNKNVKFHSMSALELPNEWENKFDIIFCAGVIHHLEKKEWDALFTNIKRCLKKDGLFIFIEPTTTSLSGIYLYAKLTMFYFLGKKRMISIMGFFDEDERYLNYFTFKKILKRHNFQKLKYYTTQLLRLPPIFKLDKINLEWINKYINPLWFGTTMIGVYKNEKN